MIDLSAPGAVDTLKDKPFTIKEGATFHIKVVFQVNHEVLSGLKYLQVVKRKGIRVGKDEEMLVSLIYTPNHVVNRSLASREVTPPTPPTSPSTRRNVSFIFLSPHPHMRIA